MANRFHFNPATGRTGKCMATHQCPFGGDDQHGATRDEARANYEAHMAPELIARPASRKSDPGIELTSPSSLTIDELPEGMDRLVELTGTNIRSYDPNGPARSHQDYYIGGKHRLLDRARVAKLPNGQKVWALPVETDGVQSTMYLPMRERVSAALRYSPEARAENAEQEERDRIWREKYRRQKAEEAERKAIEEAAEAERRAEAEAQQKRIDTIPYEKLSAEDRAASDRLKEEARIAAERQKAEAEEKHWSRRTPTLPYFGPNDYDRGQVRDDENEILQKIRGVPDYDLEDYNNRIEQIADSDLPREEQERQIREERMGYIQSLNSLLDRRMERANSTRATRDTFRGYLRSFFQSPNQQDMELRADAQTRVRRDRQAVLEFASALFEAPPYTRVHFSARRF